MITIFIQETNAKPFKDIQQYFIECPLYMYTV